MVTRFEDFLEQFSDEERLGTAIEVAKSAIDFARRLGASEAVYAELALQRLLDDERLGFDVFLVRREDAEVRPVRTEGIDPRILAARDARGLLQLRRPYVAQIRKNAKCELERGPGGLKLTMIRPVGHPVVEYHGNQTENGKEGNEAEIYV